MKVALICPADFTVVLCCKWLIKHLQKKRIEVIVLSPVGKDDFYLKTIRELNVKHVNIKMNRHINIFDDFKYIFKMIKVFKQQKVNATISVCTKPNLYSPIAAKLSGIDSIYTSVWGRGTGFLETKSFKALLIKIILISLYKISFSLSKLIWFTNPNDMNYFLKKNILKKNKSLLTYNYIDSEIYKPNNTSNKIRNRLYKELHLKKDDLIVILVGRMIWSKGIREFVEAGKILYKKYSNIKLILVGAEEKNNPDSIPKSYLVKLASLSFIQWVNFRKDVPNLYSISNIAVLPSYYKEGGYPRAVTEPMSMGIPVIACNTVDCKGPIVDNKNGLLVEPKNPKDLAKKIKKLIENKNLYEKVSKQARLTILNKFDEKKIVKNLVDKLYDDSF